MEKFFNSMLNANTINALKQGAAFFMGGNGSHIPPIIDSFSGNISIGANFFNLKLSFDLGGKGHTDYVRMNEGLSSNRDWFSNLPRESRPRGILYREDGTASKPGYSFVVPTAALAQNKYQDGRILPDNNYVPYQTSKASMGNFNEFVQEQFANAINASLTNTPFKNNIQPHEMEQFKTQLIDEISRNPAFMTTMINNACNEVLDYHNVPFDRNNFIEKARDETSPEFTRFNSAINEHVQDMRNNGKESFNPEFNELAKPLVEKVVKIVAENPNPQSAVNEEISDFVKKMIGEDKTATVLADAYAGTFVDKALDMVRTGDKIAAGVKLAGDIINNDLVPNDNNSTLGKIVDFCKKAVDKIDGEELNPKLDKVVKVAKTIMDALELKGDKSLKTYFDQNNTNSFFTNLNQTIQKDPQLLDQAIAQLSKSQQQEKTQSKGKAVKL